VRATIKLAVSPQAACRMQEDLRELRELHGARMESRVTIGRRMCCWIAAVRPGRRSLARRCCWRGTVAPRGRITRLRDARHDVTW